VGITEVKHTTELPINSSWMIIDSKVLFETHIWRFLIPISWYVSAPLIATGIV
jgi:hypothetical protein